MNKAMAWVRKPFWPLTKTKGAILGTILYIGVIGSIRYDALQLTWCGKLNELGDFLTGLWPRRTGRAGGLRHGDAYYLSVLGICVVATR